jgi:hypothetical protein
MNNREITTDQAVLVKRYFIQRGIARDSIASGQLRMRAGGRIEKYERWMVAPA